MSSQPQENPTGGGSDHLRGETPPERANDESLLERVIQQTVSDIENSTGDVGALQEVVRRFPGHRWEDDETDHIPVVHGLVEAVLTRRFRHLSDNADMWRLVFESVSSSLLEDPYSRNRLRALWNQLCESLP
jgi:hypothetical protein